MKNQAKNIGETITSLMVRIEEHAEKAQALKTAYIADMQKDSGYAPVDATVTVLKDVQGTVSGVTISNGTFYNVKAALAAGYLVPIKTEPSEQLIAAVDALESDFKNFDEIIGAFKTQHVVTVKAQRKAGTKRSGIAGEGKLQEVLSIDPTAQIALVDVGMSHPHIQGALSNGKTIDIDCYAATLHEHVNKALGKA